MSWTVCIITLILLQAYYPLAEHVLCLVTAACHAIRPEPGLLLFHCHSQGHKVSLAHYVSFWAQKLCWPILTISGPRNWHILSVSGPRNRKYGSASFLVPEADIMGQFLGPETYTFCQFLVPIGFFSRILGNRKRKKQFEHALDYVWVQ